MIELYYAPSTASLVVHWLLIELGLPHELRRLNLEAREQKSPEYLTLNPAGVVPTLVIDGQPICEAVAITLHLADTYSAGNLAPPTASLLRAQYYQWMCFMANTLQPNYRAWFYPSEPAGESNIDDSRAQARARLETAWEQVATHLAAHGPYLLGERLSAVDFMLTMLMRWSRNMPKPVDQWPVLHAYAQRMKSRPSFKQVYAREGLTDWT
jgi:glutathione S-transferase